LTTLARNFFQSPFTSQRCFSAQNIQDQKDLPSRIKTKRPVKFIFKDRLSGHSLKTEQKRSQYQNTAERWNLLKMKFP